MLSKYIGCLRGLGTLGERPEPVLKQKPIHIRPGH